MEKTITGKINFISKFGGIKLEGREDWINGATEQVKEEIKASFKKGDWCQLILNDKAKITSIFTEKEGSQAKKTEIEEVNMTAQFPVENKGSVKTAFSSSNGYPNKQKEIMLGQACNIVLADHVPMENEELALKQIKVVYNVIKKAYKEILGVE